MAREQMQIGKLASQWSLRLGVLFALAAILTACGAQPESSPATTEPAATTAAPTSAPATTAADDEDQAATAVADDDEMASPVASPVAAAATPVRRNRDNATPVGEVALTAGDCAAYLAWKDEPGVQAALAYTANWPQILAEGEKLAAGEPVDAEAMQTLYAELDGQAGALRDTGSDELGHDAVAYAGRAMGLASRMAGGLGDGTLTQAEAGDAVADLRVAIGRYELDAAARDAACA